MKINTATFTLHSNSQKTNSQIKLAGNRNKSTAVSGTYRKKELKTRFIFSVAHRRRTTSPISMQWLSALQLHSIIGFAHLFQWHFRGGQFWVPPDCFNGYSPNIFSNKPHTNSISVLIVCNKI